LEHGAPEILLDTRPAIAAFAGRQGDAAVRSVGGP
jgi:hypothetical protein